MLDTERHPHGRRVPLAGLGPDGVQSRARRCPTLPKQIADVTSTDGEVLRGVGFVSGTYSDTPGVTTRSPARRPPSRTACTPISCRRCSSRSGCASVNYFGALDGNGTDGRTRLIDHAGAVPLGPGQHHHGHRADVLAARAAALLQRQHHHLRHQHARRSPHRRRSPASPTRRVAGGGSRSAPTSRATHRPASRRHG